MLTGPYLRLPWHFPLPILNYTRYSCIIYIRANAAHSLNLIKPYLTVFQESILSWILEYWHCIFWFASWGIVAPATRKTSPIEGQVKDLEKKLEEQSQTMQQMMQMLTKLKDRSSMDSSRNSQQESCKDRMGSLRHPQSHTNKRTNK